MGKRLQTVAAMACLKSLLMVFNVVFWMSLARYLELSAEFSRLAPWLLLGCGGLIVIVASLACCCTMRGQPVMLYIYGSFLLVMFGLEMVAGTYLYTYRTRLSEGFERGLNQTMKQYDSKGAEEQSKDLDFMQSSLQCCGINGQLDWLNTNYRKVPFSCCMHPRHCDPKDTDHDVFKEGCYTKLTDVLNGNIGIIAGVAVVTAFFPIIGAIFACCLARNINHAKYEQMA
ncbi:hypothetical protein B566_EDAN001417 [Ephemera danica]|nr:hypothetical protein B566_EDAN001417 [Ephemera danica]